MLFLLVLLLGMTASAGAHVGDRVYPIYYVGHLIGAIQLDGFVDEWAELLGDPTMTLLDFRESDQDTPPEPSTLDFKIWLGWSDDPARFWLAYVGSDDIYKNTYTPDNFICNNDCISIGLDADHSGGTGCWDNDCFTNNTWADAFGQTQYYEAIASAGNNRFIDSAPFISGQNAWHVVPPFGDAMGSIAGENPYISVIELYVTPFNRWSNKWDSEEANEITSLAAGQIIGFTVNVQDYDPPEGHHDSKMLRLAGEGSGAGILVGNDLHDGLLLGQEGTAVEDVTWGRIKASLSGP